jgi:hypothetical protein
MKSVSFKLLSGGSCASGLDVHEVALGGGRHISTTGGVKERNRPKQPPEPSPTSPTSPTAVLASNLRHTNLQAVACMGRHSFRHVP